MSDFEVLSGIVVRAQSGFFDVETERGVVVAQVRGRHQRRRLQSDLIAIGDKVVVHMLEDGTAAIDQIAERESALSRRAPGREHEQIIVANPDQSVFVFSCAEPAPNLRMLDRLLVVTEEQAIPAMICANKIDLVGTREAKGMFGVYDRVGYPVFYTSAKTGRGVPKLRRALEGQVSVFAGPSGAGKTSLLNAIEPELGLRIGDVSDATGKGTHTTVVPKLVRLENGGYVADTPGLKAFALWDIEAEELDGYFPEIRPLVAACAFANCTHLDEPDCAVIAAVEKGGIDAGRYESYVRMRLGDAD
jgi:ribosome biogenesis GTPase